MLRNIVTLLAFIYGIFCIFSGDILTGFIIIALAMR